MTDSTLTPEEELTALEHAAMDGTEVTPTQMADARERISLAGLIAKGAAMRTEQKRKKDAAALQAKTKTDVAKVFTEGEYENPLVAYDAAVAALNHLADVIKRNSELVDEASDDLSRGGVVKYNNWAAMPDDIDQDNHASVAQGNDVHYVVLGGVAYRKENASLWVRAAVQTVAQQHGGLSIPGSSSLAQVVRGDRPGAVQNRAV